MDVVKNFTELICIYNTHMYDSFNNEIITPLNERSKDL